MKKVFLSICLLFGLSAIVSAQEKHEEGDGHDHSKDGEQQGGDEGHHEGDGHDHDKEDEEEPEIAYATAVKKLSNYYAIKKENFTA